MKAKARFLQAVGAHSPIYKQISATGAFAHKSDLDVSPLPDDEELARQARGNLLAFTRYTYQAEFDQDRREPYVVNDHHQILSEELDDCLSGKNPFLFVSMPPQHGKSELASRRLIAYALGRNPDEHVIHVTYAQDLANDFAQDVRNIMATDRYRQVFPRSRILSNRGGSRRSRNTLNTFSMLGAKGTYRARGIGGGISGRPGSLIVFDDPYKGDGDSQSKHYRRKVKQFFQKVARTRGTKDIRIIVIHTRWHEDDLIGDLKREAEKGIVKWRPVIFRAEARGHEKDPEQHPKDKRKAGEYLWPAFKDAEALRAIREDPDPSAWNSLYQQDPSGEQGLIYSRDWFENRWERLPSFDGNWLWTVDPKGGSVNEKSSRFCAQLWFQPFAKEGTIADGERIFLVDERRGVWEIDVCFDVLQELAKDPLWGRATVRLIEKKADGAALIRLAKNRRIPFIEPYEPGSRDYLARYKSITAFWRDGFVWLPADGIAPWISQTGPSGDPSWIEEHALIPFGRYDDRADCSTMAIDHFFMKMKLDAGEDPSEYWRRFLGENDGPPPGTVGHLDEYI